MRDLDELDRKLIAELRTDGRASTAELARRLRVSRPTVTGRIDRLTRDGIVLGFTVRIREGQGPEVVRAVSLIEVEGRSTDEVINRLRGLPEIHALHSTNGGWDLVAELQTASLTDFDSILGRIRSVDGIVNTETSILLSSVMR